ncbi:MarR family transcriptional regulator [Micromonospora sp. WMMC415]|uniref:helix-turn-helix domain-containing protein n=1 Tax=Micromonospora sp. WMMC415 TaxID=2675222 RepID=UPI0012B4F2CE|nr:MarR family transcriptional regulator [Micromonospora sp. WMMC415]
MSQAVKAALLASKDLKPTDRLVLVAIAAHSNREGQAWPSVQTIADYAGVSPRTVHRVLARLVQLGRLVVSKVAGIASNVYRLVVDAVTHAGPGSAIPGPDTANQAAGSANHSGGLAEEVLEDQSKGKPRAGARESWRRFLPKTKTPQQQPQQRQPYGHPERRGAALPPERHAERCSRHLGELAHNCRCCRSEALAGGR